MNDKSNMKIVLSEPMEAAELAMCFSSSQTNPVFRGVMNLLDQSIMDSLHLAQSPNVPDKENFMALGETRALENVKIELIFLARRAFELEQEGLRPDPAPVVNKSVLSSAGPRKKKSTKKPVKRGVAMKLNNK